mmetsp:Transcript_16939/g.41627  ORF Transcript_16939/g.41627 Transcript_16939/m.41627 type:complete len:114 (-) Transcript_16939:260-601(-)
MSNSAYSKWELQRNEVLRKRSQAENKKKKETLVKAESDLTKFYADRDSNRKVAAAAAQDEEKNKHDDHTNLIKNGTKWEKVGRLIDLKPSSEKMHRERMRKLLLLLKNSQAEK